MIPADYASPAEPLHVIAVSTTMDCILLLVAAILRYGGEPDYRRIHAPEELAGVVRDQAGDVIVGLWPDFRFAASATAFAARDATPLVRTLTLKTFGGNTMLVVVRKNAPAIGAESDRFAAALERLLTEIREQANLFEGDALPISRVMTAAPPASEPYRQTREMVTHDLRNLATVILGCGEVLAEQLENSAESRYVNDLMTAARSVARLLADLKPDHAHAPVVDAAVVLAGARGMLQALAGEWVTISLQMSSSPVMVSTDRRRLESVAADIVVHARLVLNRGSLIDISIDQIVLPVKGAYPPLQPGPYASITFAFATRKGTESAGKASPAVVVSKELAAEMGLGNVRAVLEQSAGVLLMAQKNGRLTAMTIFLPAPGASGPRRGM